MRSRFVPATSADHIVLLGSMGVGKTTVGRLVAERLGRKLRDSDTDLRAVHRNARQMAAQQGVDVLHRIEADLLLDALAVEQALVIAAAASVVDDERCVEALQQPAITVVWLHAPLTRLLPRLTQGDHRRDLGADPQAALEALAGRRDPLYRRLADVEIDVSDHGPEESAQAVLDARDGDGPATRFDQAGPG
jgi:shikimate kinase